MLRFRARGVSGAHRGAVLGRDCRRSRRVARSAPCRCSVAEEALEAYTGQQGEPLVETNIAEGRLVVEPLRSDDIEGATLLLVRAFAGTPDFTNAADAKEYMETVVDQPPDAVVLVARLYPREGSAISLGEGQDSRIVGVVGMSYTEETREETDHLPAPLGSAYLANMSVDPKCRRMGIGRVLLDACYRVTRFMAPHMTAIYLHVLPSNDAATALYTSAGFTTVRESSWMVRMWNKTPVRLMERRLDA